MGEPVATPRHAVHSAPNRLPKDQLLSSSPAFGTPAFPITERQRPALRQPFAPNTNTTNVHTVLPIILPPQTLRPVAFRTLTKKHNLTLTSSGLGVLSTFVGKFCGSGWREDGLAERVMDEIAKSWKRCGGGLIVEDGADKKLSNILKNLEPCMSGGRIDTGKLSRQNSSLGSLSCSNSLVSRPEVSRDDSQTSLGISALNVDEPEQIDQDEFGDLQTDARPYLKLVSAFSQPRLTYSTSKKSLEQISGPASLLPPIQHKISMFRNRYHLVHQRLLRNESFQTPSFSTANRPRGLARSGSSAVTMQQAYKITPISNLLGRSGSSHLLLGMLVHSAAGDLALTDLSGSVVLDLSMAHPIPQDGAWFCPGMIVLVEGAYSEDGSNNSNLGVAAGVGGQIKGHFIAETMAGPPAERRGVTIGLSQGLDPTTGTSNPQTSVGAGFGWIDFLGVGSEKAIGSQMRRIQRKIFGARPPAQSSMHSETGNVAAPQQVEDQIPRRTNIAILGECNLDSPRTLEAIRAILASYANASTDAADYPLSIVMMGNFVSAASMAGSTKGGGSVEYKEHFDALASILSEFPALLSSTTFVFVPGDNDPWASSFSAGGACVIPRQGVPELFTSRIRRAFVSANAENAKRDKTASPGEAIWASNPARMSLFGPLEEIVLFRDDITSRFRRHAVTFPRVEGDDDDEAGDARQQEPARSEEDPEALESETTRHDSTLDAMVHEAASHLPTARPHHAKTKSTATSIANQALTLPSARKLIKSLLDQSHLSPFPHSIRPVFWDHAASLSLYPLPTALVLADAETPLFTITYEGCHVMNPGKVVDELGMRRGLARWIEFDVKAGRGAGREVRF